MNQLHFGDNIDVLRNPKLIKDEAVDLIYLDPPFNSNAIYSVIFSDRDGEESEAQLEAFKDTWSWGPSAAQAYADIEAMRNDLTVVFESFRKWMGTSARLAYLAMMAVRLVEMHRTLKPTGSLYLHCDPTASHYLKVVLDTVFGAENFRSEIIWKRTSAHSGAKRFGPVHDTIFFYSKTDEYVWNQQYTPYDQQYVDAFFTHLDEKGRRWQRTDLTGPGVRTGDSALPWGGYDPTAKKRHWQPPSYFYDKYEKLTGEPLAKYPFLERFDRLDAIGLIHKPAKVGGMPRGKRYLEDAPGIPAQDVWTDLRPIHNMSEERLGYPTQKPRALLERIISASSNPGDVVLDPFCGCGTAVDAAQKLGRQWIGIDITHYAVTLIEGRLKKNHPNAEYKISGRPTDLAGARDLADRDKYQFQWWAAWRLGAQTYESKKGGDRGIDGNIYFANGPFGLGRIIISVKAGWNVNPAMVRELAGTVDREDAEMGILVTLGDPTPGMVRDSASYGFVAKTPHGRLPRVQIVTAQDLVDGRFPSLPPVPAAEYQPQVRRKTHKDQLEMLLPFAGTGGLRTSDGGMIDPRFVRFG